MTILRKLTALFVCFAVVTWSQGNSFDKVRYNGGSVATNVKPDDWDNKLIVNPDSIVLKLKDGQTVNIPPKQVTTLSYGQEAHRRVGTAIGLAVISLGVGALFALHKTKLHFIGINYTDKDGKKQGVLLQGDKSNFRAILVALQGVTGAPVSVSEKERSEIPAGISTQAVKEQESPAPPASTAATDSPESLTVNSNPDGAEIYLDEAFIGNAPSTLKLTPGKHSIRVTLNGHKPWVKDILAQGGTEAHLTATLEKN
jgi:hypothetical protein